MEYVTLSGQKIAVHYDRLDPGTIAAMQDGTFEAAKRQMIGGLVNVGDRVLEVGAGIGVGTNLIASIVGPEAYIGYEANLSLLHDLIANAGLNERSVVAHNLFLRNEAMGGEKGDGADFFVAQIPWMSGLEPIGYTVGVRKVPFASLEDQIGRFRANTLVISIGRRVALLLENAELARIDKVLVRLPYSPDKLDADRAVQSLYAKGFCMDLVFGIEDWRVFRRDHHPRWT